MKKTRSKPGGASSASFVASSIEGGCAVVQLVVNGSVAICAAAAAPISSPWEWPRLVQ